MFKIQNNLSPFYLTGACPPLTKDRTSYNLRSGMNITVPQNRTTAYQSSFFPATVKNWNELDKQFREVKTIDTFKDYQKKQSGLITNKLYQKLSNSAATNQTRMRLGLSGLASQRHDYNHIDDPKCVKCKAQVEDPQHYFLICPHYARHRDEFLNAICDILYSNDIEVNFIKESFRKFLISTILRGSLLLTEEENIQVFSITQTFIRNSQRFP
jgi:hypothetical protein